MAIPRLFAGDTAIDWYSNTLLSYGAQDDPPPPDDDLDLTGRSPVEENTRKLQVSDLSGFR